MKGCVAWQYVGTPLLFEGVKMHVSYKEHKTSKSSMTELRTVKNAKGSYPALFCGISCQNVHSGAEVQNGDLWTQGISLKDQKVRVFKSTGWNTKGLWKKWNIITCFSTYCYDKCKAKVRWIPPASWQTADLEL